MRMQDAVMKLLIHQPFYGALAAATSIIESHTVSKLKMTLVPSPVLEYNREWYVSLPDNQALGVLLHELMHLLLLHALRRGARDPQLWAVACDLAVNQHIPPDMLPPDAATLEKVERRIEYLLPRARSAEVYYDEMARLLDDGFSLIQREGEVSLQCGSVSLFTVEMQTEEQIPEITAQALKRTMDQIVDEAFQSGEVPETLGGLIELPQKHSQIDWRAVFKRFLYGRGRIEARATYKRVSRRFDENPGTKRSVGLDVLIALDESGSITDEQLKTFYVELMAVNRITNARILVTEFDTLCSPPRPAAEYRRAKERTKKGGTDFRPVFELADTLKLKSVVIFTDGEGKAPERVDQRVLWVLTKGAVQPAPYGYSVHFE
jgi:predicted metal-dependent peptidase